MLEVVTEQLKKSGCLTKVKIYSYLKYNGLLCSDILPHNSSMFSSWICKSIGFTRVLLPSSLKIVTSYQCYTTALFDCSIFIFSFFSWKCTSDQSSVIKWPSLYNLGVCCFHAFTLSGRKRTLESKWGAQFGATFRFCDDLRFYVGFTWFIQAILGGFRRDCMGFCRIVTICFSRTLTESYCWFFTLFIPLTFPLESGYYWSAGFPAIYGRQLSAEKVNHFLGTRFYSAQLNIYVTGTTSDSPE